MDYLYHLPTSLQMPREKMQGDADFLYAGEPEAGRKQKRKDTVRTRGRRVVLHLLGAAILLSFVSWSWLKPVAKQGSNSNGIADDFNWTAITPSSDLKWHECYGQFYCARLTVPLDYADPSGEKGAVALLKSPGTIKPSDPAYRGPILFNPGGPGGPGVLVMRQTNVELRGILGDEFDLIGFDPRGVGHTTPPIHAFLNDLESLAWDSKVVVDANSSAEAVGLQYSNAQILGKLVEERSKKAAEHVGTPAVARDMLSIVKAHGKDKLLYWGYSYGTVLGATFATMFPDKVERMVLDGVEDPDNYYATLWDNNLRDTTATYYNLLQSCVDAGPSVCPMHENSTSLLHDRIQRLTDHLAVEPSPFYDPTTQSYGAYDRESIRYLAFRILYSVHAQGAYYFSLLHQIEQHAYHSNITDPSPSYRPHLGSYLKCNCSEPRKRVELERTVTMAIACGDGDPVERSVEGLREHYEKMTADSKEFAYMWFIRGECSGWRVRAKEQIRGPFGGNTSHPLLIIGNTEDPVTPLWNAHKVSKGFNGSVVLAQNSPGHCTFSAASICTNKHIRNYFQTGVLPKPDTVCEVESSVFGDKVQSLLEHGSEGDLSAEDKALLRASWSLQQKDIVASFGGLGLGGMSGKRQMFGLC